LFFLHACSKQNNSADGADLFEQSLEPLRRKGIAEAKAQIAEAKALAALVKPANYAFRESGGYGYVSEPSEEEKKRGKTAGQVAMFAFRGESKGVYKISALDDQGRTNSHYECRNPCVVIKRVMRGSVSRLAYNPESLVGAAFADAFAGQLEVTREPPPAHPPAPQTTMLPTKVLPAEAIYDDPPVAPEAPASGVETDDVTEAPADDPSAPR
jgi:hypothetical protein